MTFCLGMRVAQGLVGIADTRVLAGNECITAKKVKLYERAGQSIFVMSSGLRSVRDKALTYFEETFGAKATKYDRLYQVVNAFAEQVRLVAEEDGPALEKSGLDINIHCLIGGQLRKDQEPKLYLLYPQGNWVEVTQGTPYCIIGATGYGKPVLDRTLTYEDPMRFALKVGCLAFDSTRISAVDVDFPMDVVLYVRDSFKMVEHRFEKEEMAHITEWWQDRLRDGVREIPAEWLNGLLEKVPPPVSKPRVKQKRASKTRKAK